MSDYITEKTKLNTKETFQKNYLDLGTGDGRFVVKSAQKHPENLYIGIDPAKNIEIYQREINRKKLKNAVLIQTSVENFDFHKYQDFFSGITIILPWGNLLKYVSECNSAFFANTSSILKSESECLIIFGYEEELETSETKRLNLPELNQENLEELKKSYSNLSNFDLIKFTKVNPTEVKKVNSTWAKKLTFRDNFLSRRPYFEIVLKKH